MITGNELARAAALMVAAVVIFVVLKARNQPGNLPPGPRGLPLLGYLPFLRPDLHCCFAELAVAYGPIFSLRLGSKLCVVVTSPAVAREVLRDHDALFANRDSTVAIRAYSYGGNMGWAPLGPVWAALRKVTVRELMTTRRIDALQSLRRRAMRRTVAELHQRVEPTEVREAVFVTVLRMIMGMLQGNRTSDTAEENEFRRVADGITDLLGATNVSDLFPWIGWMDLQGVERRMRVLAAALDRILNRIIDDGRLRSNGDGRSKDLLRALLELVGGGGGDEGLTLDNIKGLLTDMVLAGTDTTSTTVEWAMAELMHNPTLMRRVVDELDTVVGDNGVVEESHIPGLRYLDAVVKETLRFHPAAPLLIPHCPSTTCTVGGCTIPKGTRVLINAWAIQRDPGSWTEPLEFRPERFLEEVGGKNRDFNGGNDFVFLPFGSGRRICAGIPLAERMLKYLLATLLHSFEWRLPEGEKGLEFSDKCGLILKKAKPLVAVPVPRLSSLRLYE